MANVEHFIAIYPATPGCSQAEYERLAEESALKRKMLAQETDRKYYQSKAVSVAAYEQNVMEAAGTLK